MNHPNVTYTRRSQPNKRADNWGWIGSLALICLPVFLLVPVVRSVSAWFMLPHVVRLGFLAILLAALLGPMCYRRSRLRWRLRPSASCSIGAPSRITIVDLPDSLSEFGPWEDVPFETEAFYAPFASGPTRWHVGVAVLVGSAVVGLMLLMWKMGIPSAIPTKIRIEVLLTVPLFAGCASACLLRPTYLRISPGLLELVSYGPISGRERAIERFDLKKARLTIDLWRLVVRVSESSKERVLPMHLVRDRRRCAWLLVLAALSTHSWPSDSSHRREGEQAKVS